MTASRVAPCLPSLGRPPRSLEGLLRPPGRYRGRFAGRAGTICNCVAPCLVTRVAPRLTVSRFFIPLMYSRPASVISVASRSRIFRLFIRAICDRPWSVMRLPEKSELQVAAAQHMGQACIGQRNRIPTGVGVLRSRSIRSRFRSVRQSRRRRASPLLVMRSFSERLRLTTRCSLLR